MIPEDRQRWLVGSPMYTFHDSPASPGAVDVEFGAASHRSAKRLVNEDHYMILRQARQQETLMTSLAAHDTPQPFSEYSYTMVVADGVGGGGTGELASRIAIVTLAHLATRFARWNVRIDDVIAREVMDRADRFYRAIDSTLLFKSRGGSPGLRTTLTATYSAGRDLFVVHVGHSRAYRLRGREFICLTRDHTLAEEGGSGPLVDMTAAARDLDHILTETVGGADLAGPRTDIERTTLEDGDVLLLCTNGLTDRVSEEQIADVLRAGGSANEQCETLVDLAVKAGGQDDVTAIVARYHFPEPAGEHADASKTT